MVCSVLAGSSRATCSFVRRKRNGRNALGFLRTSVLGCDLSAKDRCCSEQTGIKKFEKTPQIAQTVFYWCAGQRETVIGFQQTCSFGALGRCVFNGLSFIENDGIEANILEQRRVTAQRSVSREDDVVVLNITPPVPAFAACMVENPQARSEACGLLFP